MGIKLYAEPKLEEPVLVAAWPGIGNVGIIAVDSLKTQLMAEELGEIEPWDFFYPRKMAIRNGVLASIEFPGNRFFYKKTARRDVIFFLAEEQPSNGMGSYAEGEKAYQMANLVLDMACRFGCRRVYTSGAAIAPIHHAMRSRVWAVPNMRHLVHEVRQYPNTVLMSDVEGQGGQGNITGLNGLLIGAAKQRGVEAICLMGEVPIYLQGFPFPYPKASKSVMEALAMCLGLAIEIDGIGKIAERSEREIDGVYANFPPEVKEQLDKLKTLAYVRTEEPRPITDEDKQRILEDIDGFFSRGTRED